MLTSIRWNSFFVLLNLTIFSFLMVFFGGCGKHETTGSVMGTATGGIIGAAVSKDKGTGALIGGLIGNLVGGGIGRSADDEEREEEQERQARIQARREAAQNHRIAQVEQENRVLKHQVTKWCADCNRKSTVVGANSCASCGGSLVHEKFCSRCTTLFSPEEGYKYCPYCTSKVMLSSR